MYKYFFLFLFTLLLGSLLCEDNGIDDAVAVDLNINLNVCSIPLTEPGDCKASITRYGYDGLKCRVFTWGGCDYNGNNFETIEQCQAVCEASRSISTDEVMD